jgi:branched-chain amino acid transport system permease protein
MLVIQNVVSGLASGAIYALLGLALVIVYRSTGVVNFAAGEMATFTTFIAWEFVEQMHVAFVVTLLIVVVIAALMGAAVYLAVMQPARRRPEFVTVMLTFGLFEIFNGFSNSFWDPAPRSFPAPVNGKPVRFGSIFITQQSIANVVIALLVMAVLLLVFRYTRLGLGFRATTDNALAARIVGIQPAHMFAAGWAMASAAGGIAGMLLANLLLLSPTMMGNVLVFSLVAVIVGGLESPAGAVVGGLAIGALTGGLAGVKGIGPDLATPAMLVVVVAVLLVRPSGLFGQVKARKL